MTTPSPTPVPEPAPAPNLRKPAKGASSTSAISAGVTRFAPGVTRGRLQQGERIGIYGPGGIGKTELCAAIQQVGIEPLFIDLDGGSLGLDVARAMNGDHLVSRYDEIRATLQNREVTSQFGAVVIDTFSALEERVREHVLETVPKEKGQRQATPAKSIEDYGFGKGYIHVFEAAILVLQDLDALCRQGKHAIVVCHQAAERVPSAETDDYLEYQPRLQSPPKAGKLRERVFEWCNHFVRVDHDRAVEDGKAMLGDSRTIHTVRTATPWAKHRSLASGREIPETIPYTKGSFELWNLIFGQ